MSKNTRGIRDFKEFGRTMRENSSHQEHFKKPFVSPMIYEKDGYDHINVSTQGETELGQLLSLRGHSAFDHPKFGRFNSVEGFWRYIASFERDDRLRKLYGDIGAFKASKIKLTRIHVVHLHGLILDALYRKITSNPSLLESFKKSTLPFTAYYYPKSKEGVSSVRQTSVWGYWVVPGLEMMRDAIKDGIEPNFFGDMERDVAYELAENSVRHYRDMIGVERKIVDKPEGVVSNDTKHKNGKNKTEASETRKEKEEDAVTQELVVEETAVAVA